jgi:hypothetical protein
MFRPADKPDLLADAFEAHLKRWAFSFVHQLLA